MPAVSVLFIIFCWCSSPKSSGSSVSWKRSNHDMIKSWDKRYKQKFFFFLSFYIWPVFMWRITAVCVCKVFLLFVRKHLISHASSSYPFSTNMEQVLLRAPNFECFKAFRPQLTWFGTRKVGSQLEPKNSGFSLTWSVEREDGEGNNGEVKWEIIGKKRACSGLLMKPDAWWQFDHLLSFRKS